MFKKVGFPARYHAWNFGDSRFEYMSHVSCEYSMVLTGAAFYHRFYNFYFSRVMGSRIRAHIDEVQNCEDIAFNMMVAHLTRQPPLKVTCKWNFNCPECEAVDEAVAREGNSQAATVEPMLSMQSDHFAKRSRCLNYFVDIYGYNPLLYSQYRADSVLYRTKLPLEKQKCFKFV